MPKDPKEKPVLVIDDVPTFLAKRWATEVEFVRPVPRDLITRGKALVEGVVVDLDAALRSDET
jgi:antitoxin PrlF